MEQKKTPDELTSPGVMYFYPALTYSLTWDSNTIGTKSLTTVFGMGTGVAFSLWAPGLTLFMYFRITSTFRQEAKIKIERDLSRTGY